MRLSHAPYCPKCDSGKKPHVIVELDDTLPAIKPLLYCGSCWGRMFIDWAGAFTMKEPCVIQAVENLIVEVFGDCGRTAGAFEIIDWGDLTDNGKAHYRVVLAAREAPEYRVEIHACTRLAALSSPKPQIVNEQKVLRRATMPHVLVQAVDTLNHLGFRGRHRSRDQKENWVYLDHESREHEQLSYRAKMTWPIGG